MFAVCKFDVYISSSWKNRERVRELADLMRKRGFKPYDFTDPSCRGVPEIPPEAFPAQFDPEQHVYRDYIQGTPEWRAAVEYNRRVLNGCAAVVLVLPCGNDAHADWAYAVGRGKKSIVLGHPRAGERTPTHMWADAFAVDEFDVLNWLQVAVR